MRIVQIIDSLEIGGAEKMAVNYANSLANTVAFSGLVATRKEGNLKNQLNKNVDYLFLKKSETLDFFAILRLRSYCKNNRIEYIQSHSSSFFTAFLVKLLLPKIKIIWHDHNGLSEFLSSRKERVLKIVSHFFAGIVVVNYKLKTWAETSLNCKNVLYLPNFTTINSEEVKVTNLNGIAEKKILCLANLRFQKNHFLLIEVAIKLKKSHPDWTFHLVGKDFEDEYSSKVKKKITDNNLSKNVFIYGSKQDTFNIINQANICILTSQSEGLPVAILEYGLCKKPVISTNVGQIKSVIKDNQDGFLVDKYDVDSFYNKLKLLIDDVSLQEKFAQNLYTKINNNHSEQAIVEKFISWIKTNE